MKKMLNALRVAYYTVGIIGILICIPFYVGFYFWNRTESQQALHFFFTKGEKV